MKFFGNIGACRAIWLPIFTMAMYKVQKRLARRREMLCVKCGRLPAFRASGWKRIPARGAQAAFLAEDRNIALHHA
jgi:hypothetical protein